MSVRKPIIAANWKMHKTRHEVENFFNTLMSDEKEAKTEIWIAPSATSLSLAAQKAQGSSIWIGAQNIFYEPQGAFTGEISAGQAADAGARFVIIGHSERRRLFGETHAQIKRKIELALHHHLVPLLCIGETLEERKRGETKSILKAQLTEVLTSDFDGIIAYEPIWAIGTGQSAQAEVIEEVHALCRDILTLFCAKGPQIPILYGGSVTLEAISFLRKMKEVGGALVGNASLEAQSFISIIQGYAQ